MRDISALALQIQGPDFDHKNQHKLWAQWHVLVMSVLQRQRHKIPRAQWSATSAEYASSGPARGPGNKVNSAWRMIYEVISGLQKHVHRHLQPRHIDRQRPYRDRTVLAVVNPSLWCPKSILAKVVKSALPCEYPGPPPYTVTTWSRGPGCRANPALSIHSNFSPACEASSLTLGPEILQVLQISRVGIQFLKIFCHFMIEITWNNINWR